MHITPPTPGQFPQSANLINHASRAYGVKPVMPVQQAAAAQQIGGASFTLKPDVYQPSPPTSAAQNLVAGNVAGGVNFDASPRAQQANAIAYQMYTRAADKIEAAVAVQVGRALDVRG